MLVNFSEVKTLPQKNVPMSPFNFVVREWTSAALKISESIVWRVINENSNAAETGQSKSATPGEKTQRNSLVTDCMDSFAQNAIQQNIYNYYTQGKNIQQKVSLCN